MGNHGRGWEPALKREHKEGVDNSADSWVEQKVPIIGDYFVREVPPSDNVSSHLGPDPETGLMLWSTAVLRGS